MRYLIIVSLFFVNALAAITPTQLDKLKQDAREGNDLAQFDLGIRFFYGEDVTKNEVEAFKWFSRAAEKENGLAQFYLAVCYAGGKGVNKDASKSTYWKIKAERNGITRDECAPNLKISSNGSTDAKTVGYVRPKESPLEPLNPNAPIDSSNPLDAKSQYEKGRQYFAKKNIAEAAKWYRKAAEQGHAGSMFGLAVCYKNGSADFEQNQVEATKWFIKCALNGWYHAQDVVATCYRKGIGIEKNITECYAYASLAADKNYPPAVQHLKELEATLSPSEIEAGIKRKSELVGIIELNKKSMKSGKTTPSTPANASE
jgi:TPR repeat protein